MLHCEVCEIQITQRSGVPNVIYDFPDMYGSQDQSADVSQSVVLQCQEKYTTGVDIPDVDTHWLSMYRIGMRILA